MCGGTDGEWSGWVIDQKLTIMALVGPPEWILAADLIHLELRS